jgi:hypothetical protein
MAVPVSKTKEQDNLASLSSATSEVRNLPVFPPSCSQMPAQPLLSHFKCQGEISSNTIITHGLFFEKYCRAGAEPQFSLL